MVSLILNHTLLNILLNAISIYELLTNEKHARGEVNYIIRSKA
jgi:hypothetical protein